MAKEKYRGGLDTTDNIYTNKENQKIRFLKVWAIIGPLVGFVLGCLIGGIEFL
jgi:hypothetical protein